MITWGIRTVHVEPEELGDVEAEVRRLLLRTLVLVHKAWKLRSQEASSMCLPSLSTD